MRKFSGMGKAFRQGGFLSASRLIERALKLGRVRLFAGIRSLRQPRTHDNAVGNFRLAPQPREADFRRADFNFGDGRHAYCLYVPGIADAADPAPLPLVVLLHGCRQDAADFAEGTAMNAVAERNKCLVLYPEQAARANRMRCWNWFEAAHQRRDAGEPALIAAMTRHILKTHNGDAARVYVAGLSAGGAMAATVARLYPELFAAVGVHSGVPAGAATNAMSAFSAMRRGARRDALAALVDATRPAAAGVPTIVFHGGADRTVHPKNGGLVVSAALAALSASGLALAKAEHVEDNPPPGHGEAARSTQRTTYSTADGKRHVEYWAVEAGPHAWSGGNSKGSFTDPQGPDASRVMLEFLLQHRLAEAR